MGKKISIAAAALILICHSLAPQTHTAVPLDDSVYYILEQAHMRGLCGNLPEAKPYTRSLVLKSIGEILSHDGPRSITEAERRILEDYRDFFSPRKQGFDLKNAAYYFEYKKDAFRITGDFNIDLDLLYSIGINGPKDAAWSTDNWIVVNALGDIGYSFSYGFSIFGGVLRAPRSIYGTYNTYYEGFIDYGQFENQEMDTYSEPLSYFPFSYRKRWDGFVWNFNNVSNAGQLPWPQENISMGYGVLAELSGEHFDNRLFYRFGRVQHEWGSMSNGSGLTLNQAARPFMALEITFMPIGWFAMSSMTGILEYYNLAGIKASAESSQNAFSITMLEFNIKNYLHFDVGSTSVWAKRFELGYLFPLISNFLYQNSIGDFDNLALFLSLKGQYPGIGKIWFSFFLDEANPERDFFKLDRMMYAYQFGISAAIPWLSFTSVKASYTKNEPYNYSHIREYLPWYGDIKMETNYVNNGVSLGHYLPPNSDEILFRVETMPFIKSKIHLQYQLIRHGADYGSKAVDGGSLWSELDPDGRSDKPELKKYFLKDGAYKWMHIVKLGGEFSISNLPFRFFGETGVVFSYFTDIEGPANSGNPSGYSKINTAEYPHSQTFILTVGVRLFPK